MMKKLVSLLLCAALILTILPGCDREEEIPEETAAPTAPVVEVELETQANTRKYTGVELQFLSMLEEDAPGADVLMQAAEVFYQQTGAAVQIQWLGGDEALLTANLEEGAKVDIFSASLEQLSGTIGMYALELTEMAAQEGYEEHSYPVLLEQIIERCGRLIAIPQIPYVYGVYYNADAFDEIGVEKMPESWEDFLKLSEALTRGGYKPMAMDAERANMVLELHLERSLGFEKLAILMTEGGWPLEEYYVELFQRAIDFADAGYLSKGDPTAFPGGQNKIALSNVAMVVGGNEMCLQVEQYSKMETRWGVFPYPGDGAGKGYGIRSDTLAIHAQSENPEAAFEFLMLLTTGEFDQLYADVTGGIPADPNNFSAIVGARELLMDADTRLIGLLKPEHNELFCQLWNGWYKRATYFAGAINNLAWYYQPEPTEGVG